MKKIQIAALASALVFGLVGLAQEPSLPKEAPKGDVAKKGEAGVLSVEQLPKMLEAMGYEVRVEGEEGKTQWAWVKVTREELGGTFEVSIALSPNKKKIWAHLYMANLTDEHLSNAKGLAKLLELNATEGPNHFRIDAKTKQLYLSRCCDNAGMTPANLKENLENLINGAVRTKDAWNVSKWKAE